MSITITTPAANARKVTVPILASGTYDPANCPNPKIRISYYDSTGAALPGSPTAWDDVNKDSENGAWDYQFGPAPNGAVTFTIEVTCDNGATINDSVSGTIGRGGGSGGSGGGEDDLPGNG